MNACVCVSDGLITRDCQEVDEGIKYEGAKLCFAANNRNTKLCTVFGKNTRSEWGMREGCWKEERRYRVSSKQSLGGRKGGWEMNGDG